MVPLLVPSRSPWNCLSMVKRPSVGSSVVCGVSLTSKVPVAWVMRVLCSGPALRAELEHSLFDLQAAHVDSAEVRGSDSMGFRQLQNVVALLKRRGATDRARVVAHHG